MHRHDSFRIFDYFFIIFLVFKNEFWNSSFFRFDLWETIEYKRSTNLTNDLRPTSSFLSCSLFYLMNKMLEQIISSMLRLKRLLLSWALLRALWCLPLADPQNQESCLERNACIRTCVPTNLLFDRFYHSNAYIYILNIEVIWYFFIWRIRIKKLKSLKASSLYLVKQ